MYGSSERVGAFPASEPVTPGDLAATIFWRFGIGPGTEVQDAAGRPFLVAEGKPLTALFAR